MGSSEAFLELKHTTQKLTVRDSKENAANESKTVATECCGTSPGLQ